MNCQSTFGFESSSFFAGNNLQAIVSHCENLLCAVQL